MLSYFGQPRWSSYGLVGQLLGEDFDNSISPDGLYSLADQNRRTHLSWAELHDEADLGVKDDVGALLWQPNA